MAGLWRIEKGGDGWYLVTHLAPGQGVEPSCCGHVNPLTCPELVLDRVMTLAHVGDFIQDVPRGITLCVLRGDRA